MQVKEAKTTETLGEMVIRDCLEDGEGRRNDQEHECQIVAVEIWFLSVLHFAVRSYPPSGQPSSVVTSLGFLGVGEAESLAVTV